MLDFAKVKLYFEAGYWTKEMVGKAVSKQVITPEQYQEITGEFYTS